MVTSNTVVSPHNKLIFFPFQGKLHFTERSCALVLKHDFDYWGVDEMMLEPCCALKYYPEMEVCSKEQEGERRAKRRMQVRTKRDFPPKLYFGCFRSFLPAEKKGQSCSCWRAELRHVYT